MIFCPKCGTRLTLVVDKSAAGASRTYQCAKCGYRDGNPSDIHEREIIIKKPSTPEGSIVVLDGEALGLHTNPTYRAECPKCHNDLAYVWQVQTRAGDEGSTQFFRCTKCSHTWRLYT